MSILPTDSPLPSPGSALETPNSRAISTPPPPLLDADYEKHKALRSITRHAYRDLNDYVIDVKGRFPVFGYPLISYIPSGDISSYWTIISKSITNKSSK